MPLSKKARTWLFILGTPVSLLLICVIALKLYFTKERLKALVVPILEETIQRPVSMGNLSLSLFPSIGLEIDSLKIANRQDPGFSLRPMVVLNTLELEVKLFPLFGGNVEVNTIILDRPDIFIEVNSEGAANYETAPAPTGETSTTEEDGGFAILLPSIRIADGTVTYLNRKEHGQTIVGGLDSRISVDLQLASGEVQVSSESSVENFSWGTDTTLMLSGLKATLQQDLLYEMNKDVLTLQNGKGTFEKLPFTVNGTITDLKKMFVMDINIEAKDANIADLLSLIPKEYATKTEGISGNGVAQVKLKITGKVNDSTKADIAGSVSTTNASVQYSGLPKPITDINIVADFSRTKTKQEFNISKLSARLGQSAIQAQLSASPFDDPVLNLNASASLNLAEVKDYYPMEQGTDVSGTLSGDVSLAGKAGDPQAMKASGKLEFKGVTIASTAAKTPVRNLNGVITINNKVIETSNLSMMLGQSDFGMTFWMQNYLSVNSTDKKAPRASAKLNLTSKLLRTDDIRSEEKTAAPTSPSQSQPAKKGSMPLPNVDMDIDASIGTFVMERLELKNVKASVRMLNDVVTIQNLSANTFGGAVVTKGSVNLQNPDQPLFDLALDLQQLQANEFLSKFMPFGERIGGTISMKTTMKGALDDTLGLVSKTLNGQGKVQIESGKLAGVKVNQQLASMLKLPDLEVINFNDWANSFSVADGRLLIKDLKIKAAGTDYVINGAHGLDGSLDYKMSLLLSDEASAKIALPGFAGEAASLFKDDATGRMKLDFNVGGNTDAPTVSLDTAPAQRKLESKLGDEKKKLEEELKKKGGDLLKDLFKKK